MTRNYDIAILGGGLVGLSAAAMFAREMPSARLCLIERKAIAPLASTSLNNSENNFDARSSALSRGSVEIFRALGFSEGLQQHACAIHEVQVSDRGHFGRVHYQDDDGKALGYVVENAWLGQSLLAFCQGHDKLDLIAPANVESIELKAGRGCLHIQSTEAKKQTLEAELLVIADGASSPLARQLGMETRVTDFHQSAVIANIECSEAHGGRAFERFTKEGPLALLPLGNSRDSQKCALVFTRPEDKVAATLAQSDQAFLNSIQERFGYQPGKFLRVGQRSHYPLSYSCATEQIRRSVVLIGNAAHFLHPVAGQGLNLALRDVSQLLAVLSKTCIEKQQGGNANYGDLAALQSYLLSQESDQYLTAAISNSFNAMFSNNQKIKQLTRNSGLLMLEMFDGLKQNVFQRMMGESAVRPDLKLYHSN